MWRNKFPNVQQMDRKMKSKNKFRMKDGDCVMIVEHKGEKHEVIIDRKNHKKIKGYKWRLDKVGKRGFYVIGYVTKMNNTRLHRFLLNAPKDMQVDHINGITLDNRESNLRLCTSKENRCNNKKHKNNTSGFKGVCYHKRDNKWHSQITMNMKKIHLGYFTDKIEAAKVYNDAAIKYHREFARLNRIVKAEDIKMEKEISVEDMQNIADVNEKLVKEMQYNEHSEF